MLVLGTVGGAEALVAYHQAALENCAIPHMFTAGNTHRLSREFRVTEIDSHLHRLYRIKDGRVLCAQKAEDGNGVLEAYAECS